ncbi:endonuclease/exonuclease/phosphatase family protein [uncultured Treponema sp.]|uniref:endonuclease/exonuclease/phosphatase family protein n=1 Tax=uncultured Treponema sp. TaxID=162155 RepID=UPI0025D2C42C|nr:endonuclease/exonuclease/phosphatase family protein [uncultured Treponema sp.]
MKKINFKKTFFNQGLFAAIFAVFLLLFSCSESKDWKTVSPTTQGTEQESEQQDDAQSEQQEESPGGQTEQKSESEPQSLKIMNWNLQTFFDAVYDGNEYDEYKNADSGWTEEKYNARLERLASVIKTIDADVITFEELEKEEQLQDIANRLAGNFSSSASYKKAFFAANYGSSLGCAVISRYPIGETSVHAIDYGSPKSTRPIIKFSVYKEGRTLTIFVNHWNSKRNDSAFSKTCREKQEKLLAKLMSEASAENQPLLATGDFNMDISEFELIEASINNSIENDENIMLNGESDFAVYSPWIQENGEYQTPGSYWYNNDWERIDHFFAAGNIKIEDFCAEGSGEWVYSNNHPYYYSLKNNQGYSDHFPITCKVTF